MPIFRIRILHGSGTASTRDRAAAAAAPGSRSDVRPGADEGDFAGLRRILRLDMAREVKRLIEVQRGEPACEAANGCFHLAMIGLECGGGSGEGVGAHQHDTVACRKGAYDWRARCRAASIKVRPPERAAIHDEVSSTTT